MNLLSKLQVGGKVGGGHFGDVHEAQDAVHGKVAVKIFTQRAGETPFQWQARKDALLKEGQHLKQATHRNVVQVLHLVESDVGDSIHLVMEFCEGGSLQSAFDSGPMKLGDVLKIATDISFGLQALHARGMLHRDIKPGNILSDGKKCWKLGDFGLVTDALLLGYGSQAGYNDHIAPEVWAGGGTSEKSDIWAFGMTIYRLLHGAEWYSRSPAPQSLVPGGGYAKSLRWLPHIPEKWRRFVRKMLHDDPAHRYQSATQVTNALAALSAHPDFRCKVGKSEVRWTKRTPSRRLIVVWKQHSPRIFEWEAKSEPLPGITGRSRVLGSSGGRFGYNKTSKQLDEFFAEKFSDL